MDGSVPVATDDQCTRALSSGADIFDTIGVGYALLSFNSENEAEAAFIAAAATKTRRSRWRIPLKAPATPITGHRPNLFIAWASDSLEAKLDAILARTLGG